MKRLFAAAVALLAASPAIADPLLFYNGRLFVHAEVNGVPTEALLDSAAEATLVNPPFAAKAGLPQGTEQTIRGSGGEAKAHIVEGVTISALGIELHPDAIVVTDLSELSKRLIKRPTQAVLGRELFDAARLEIDIRHRRLSRRDNAHRPRGVKLPLTAHAGVEAVPVLADGRPVQAEFDLGNGSDILISRSLTTRLGLKVTGRKSGGGIGGTLERDLVIIPWLKIAGVRLRNLVAAIDDQRNANDLNIGTSVLKYFLITTDFKARAVWLQPNGGVRGTNRNDADK